MNFYFIRIACAMLLALACCLPSLSQAAVESGRIIQDALGRKVTVPKTVKHIICSGAGCLRLATYLQAQDMVVGVEDIECRKKPDARPYALANTQYKTLPIFGGYRGQDDPEKILLLTPQPDVIFKTYSTSMGYDPDELQQKTGIPVIALSYGNVTMPLRKDLFNSLRTIGDVVGNPERAENVIRFFEEQILELELRTTKTEVSKRPKAFLGGVAFKGPHGFHSTEPAYPPFVFSNVINLAYDEQFGAKELSHSDISKEQIVEWNPELLFVDLSTLALGEKSGLNELRTDPAYQSLSAVKNGLVYGLLPYNWYTKNYGSILANAWYIASLVYPDSFADVDPKAKADEIYSFLVGEAVFDQLNEMVGNHAFKAIDMNSGKGASDAL